MHRVIGNLIFGATLLAATVTAAFAQQPAPPALSVEKIPSGWLFAPDVRATDLDGKTGALAGGYLGRITDRSWVIGAGGYYLTNREDDFKLWYGGPVFEWLIRADRKIGFGVRALVGAGTATLPRSAADFINPRVFASGNARVNDRRGDSRGNVWLVDPDATVAINDDFLIAEPQFNVMWNLSAGQRIVFGLGYRAVGNAPFLGDDLKGVSGSVSVQIGGK